ncbi:unnamed protein product [Urochloa humidicola]
MQSMAPAAAPPAALHLAPLLLPRRAAAANARARGPFLVAVRAQPDSASASTPTSTPDQPPEFKPSQGFKAPEPKKFAVKEGQQGSVLGLSKLLPGLAGLPA